MNSVLERTEQLERELAPEPLGGPAAGALLLHGLLLAALISYGLISGLFKHNLWGNQGGGQAMEVTISTAIPLPNDQPMNKNVLTTETPSPAPAPPSPKEQHEVDQTAIPISGKQVKPKKQTTPKTQQHQPPPRQQNLAQYGEQNGTNIPRATQPQVSSSGPVAVNDSSFGARFAWYVNQINTKMSSSWNKYEVDQRTPHGSRVYIVFSINRDGSPGRVQLDHSSGSQTLDTSCLRAAQRVDTFGPLPSAYNQSTLMVSYYCEY